MDSPRINQGMVPDLGKQGQCQPKNNDSIGMVE